MNPTAPASRWLSATMAPKGWFDVNADRSVEALLFVSTAEERRTRERPDSNQTGGVTYFLSSSELGEQLSNLVGRAVESFRVWPDRAFIGLITTVIESPSLTSRTLERQDLLKLAVINRAGRSWADIWSFGSSAKTVLDATSELDLRIASVLTTGGDETFEDGVDSDLALTLEQLILERGEEAVRAIGHMIAALRTRPGVVAEVLKLLGRIDQPATRRARRWTLERELRNTSHVIRDAAGLGLGSMGDPAALGAIEDAISNEKYELLKMGFAKVLAKLKSRKP